MLLSFRLGFFVSIFILLHVITISAQNDEDIFVPFDGQRYDTFDWEILKQLNSPDVGNVILSPLSIKLLMAILYEGVKLETPTAMEIQSVLHFPNNITLTRERFSTILNSLQMPSESYEINIKSKIYLDSSYAYQESFRNRTKRHYDADTEKINFNEASQTCKKINNWVSDATKGKITDMVKEDEVNNAVMLMLNAVFFKGKWRNEFPKNQSFKGGFYLTSTQSVTVDYMTNTGRYYYVESIDLDAKILRLPYKDSQISLYILLPNSKAGLQRLIKSVDSSTLKRHMWLMDQLNVEVILPKFKFEYKSKFGKILQKLGLKKIFDNTANLGRLAKGGAGRIFVTDILQKAGIEVNEEGSTAYATTEIQLGNKFGSPDNVFNASNPFLFYIEEEKTGTIIFAGKIENPVQGTALPFPEDLTLTDRFGTPQTNVSAIPLMVPSTGLQTNLNPTENRNLLNYRKFHYFDMELLKAVASRSNRNVLISPTSVKQVLAMVLEGADGKCAEELRNALRLPQDQRQIRELFGNLLQEYMNEEPGVIFEVANQLFISESVTPLKQYQDNLRKFYHSGIQKVNFNTPAKTANLINNWIYNVTHGLIPTLISSDSIRPETSIILANALYFKGIWEKSFSEERTRRGCFQHPDHECYHTYMMDATDTYNFVDLKELDAKALELPYRDNLYSMLIILPNKKNGMTQMLRNLPYEYDKIVKNLAMTEVVISIPRFSFEYSEDIARNLEEVEITEIFSQQKANLSRIVTGTNNDLFISNVFHKTKIEVNEQGTIAAASTGALVIPLMGSTKPLFRADHPFVFLIRHIETGTIIFAGRLTEPENADIKESNRHGSRNEQVPSEDIENSEKVHYPEAPPLYRSTSYNQQDSQQYTQPPQISHDFAARRQNQQFISQQQPAQQQYSHNTPTNVQQIKPQNIQYDQEKQISSQYQPNDNTEFKFPK